MSTAEVIEAPVVARGYRFVRTTDGTQLAVRVLGPDTAAVTVIFCHGVGLRSAEWLRQHRGLATRWGASTRMVWLDWRGHGRSGDGPSGSNTITQLGHDLASVIDAVAPTGPIVLAGHSMGGMGILAAAATHPELITTRVAGIALVSTGADRIATAGLGRLLASPLFGLLRTATRLSPALVQSGWNISRRVLSPLVGATLPALPIPAQAVTLGCQMVHGTPIATITEFLAAIATFDATAALPVLRTIPVVVMCGERDWCTPLAHSHRLAEALPQARLVTIAGARHMLPIEAADAVTDQLDRLIALATTATITIPVSVRSQR